MIHKRVHTSSHLHIYKYVPGLEVGECLRFPILLAFGRNVAVAQAG